MRVCSKVQSQTQKSKGRDIYVMSFTRTEIRKTLTKKNLKAYELFKTNNETAVDKSKGMSVDVTSDAEEEHSGGETEGSEYGLSEEDEIYVLLGSASTSTYVCWGWDWSTKTARSLNAESNHSQTFQNKKTHSSTF
jgi:hypothetical protein